MNNELYHYGVPGMKWGVRRYRNKPGSYTKTGLKVFDDKMDKYEQADRKVKSLKGVDKEAYDKAVGERKAAKKQLDRSYKQLKNDARADKGKKLYETGKTAGPRSLAKNLLGEVLILDGSVGLANGILQATGNKKVAAITGTSLAIGASIINGILAGVKVDRIRNQRAYYTHNRSVRQ